MSAGIVCDLPDGVEIRWLQAHLNRLESKTAASFSGLQGGLWTG